MKIKIVSDLHLEFSDLLLDNNQGADVLILSGDIMVAQDLHDHPEPNNTADQQAIADGTGLGKRQQAAQRYRDFLKRCSFQFPHVIYIAGNHEFYHGKFHAGLDYLRAECSKFSNVYFLENETKIIDGVVFIGATLWTDMNKGDPLTQTVAQDSMNDFRVIRNDRKEYAKLRSRDVIDRHIQSKQYIQLVLDNHKDDVCVVVGHHSPSYQSVHPNYASDLHLNGAYHSDLSELILDRPQVRLWTHGHTHHALDYMIGDTRIVCNPRGYQTASYSEDTGWDPDMIVEI
jgi:UDP-2,3-diacylglucosamine pyrophosphatase LpxH